MRPYLFLLIFLLTACQSETEIPDDVLPQEKIIDLLIEFHLLETKIENLYLLNDSARQVYAHFEPLVFEKYGVDSLHYRRSLDFYMKQPALMVEIYEVVVDSLMVREKNHDID